MARMSYLPLPDFLTIKKSSIHGLGLFTEKDIEPGVNLGPSHYLCKDGYLRLPLGGFINHSENNNLKMVRKKRFFHVVTTVYVYADQELTGNYEKWWE